MSFARGWMLVCACVPLVWLAWSRRRPPRKLTFALRALSLAAVLAAIAEPVWIVPSNKMAIAVLVDVSSSVSQRDLARASGIASRIVQSRGRNWVGVLPFARTPASVLPPGDFRVVRASGEASSATDLEAGVRASIAALPGAMVPRIVLISDGKENAGSVTRAAWQAQQLGIPIDTYALTGRPRPTLRLDSVSVPMSAFTGERFPVDLTVTSPRAVSGTIEISADGKPIGSQPVQLEEGENAVRVHASINASGAVGLSGVIRASGLGDQGEARFDRAIMLRRPHLLFVSSDPPGTEVHLMQALGAAQFDVVKAADLTGSRLDRFQIAVLNNVNLAAIPAASKPALEDFVQRGGGLLVIGGEREIYVEDKTEDALDRALPAKIAPPRSLEGTCVVLIIDKSSSMEGKKIELARLAAIGVIDNLRPIDRVGVLIFDNSFQWAVPIRRAEDRAFINRLVAGITPDGGTQIAPALSEAFHKILPEHATYKHIVLLTDGISEEGDSIELAREAQASHVTISTVGLGQDVNRVYLDKIAEFAGGKSHFLTDPGGLQQILLRDVMEHTGSTAIEKALQPLVREKTEILNGVGMENAPALKGYVKFIAKPTAETVLAINDGDPLLVRWQNGLGRAAVFTSDAKSRWASDWVTWPGFDRFWANVSRDLLPHTASGETRAEYHAATGDLTVDYRLGRSIEEPRTVPPIFIFGPAGFERPVPVVKVGSGAYRGRVAIGQREGLFRIRPLEDSAAFPEAGFYREEQEQRDFGSNEYLLREISTFTGGRFDPAPGQVFDPAGRSFPSSIRFWPGLIALALLLSLIELIVRKGPGVLAGWRGRQTAAR